MNVRVKADYDVLRDAPGIGDRLSVQGAFEDGHYGRQLIAKVVMPEPASRSSVHALLLEHFAFSGISTRAKQRLSEQLGSQLLAVLDAGDTSSLVNAGVGFDAAHNLAAAWVNYSAAIATHRFLLEQGFSLRTASMAVNLWGIDAITAVLSNPYRLLAIAPWEEVDGQATRAFQCAEDDSRRYLGVVDSIFNDAASRGRAALPTDEFRRLVESRIGCTVDADAIASAGVQAQRMRVVKNGRHRYVQGATLAQFESEIQTYLARLSRSGASSSKPRHKNPKLSSMDALCEKFAELLESNGLVLVNMPGAAAIAVDWLLRTIAGEVIVISPTSAFPGPSSERARMNRLSEFTSGAAAPDVSGKVVVVRETSALDLVMARKLLRSISGAAKLVLIGDRNMLPAFGPGHIFPGLVRRDTIASIDTTSLFQSPSLPVPLAGLPAILTTNGGLPAIAELANHFSVKSLQELTSVALSQYRIVFEENPLDCIIIASTRALATSLNECLHEEVLDYAISQGRGNATISLQGKQKVAVGDLVVFTSRDFSRGLFHGSRGLVTEIFSAAGRGTRRNPSAVARIDFDTAGPLEVSERDCQSMMLGHAVQVQHASLSRWQKVIVAVAPSQSINSSWIWRTTTRAIDELVVVELNHAFEKALTTEGRDTTYIPLFDQRSE
ncbi:hypothetical protein [Burkholderia orbicola]|uniref:hypothetical protein n=1 Tax=Burkholderia orbicola TaxID=2978683 RepID=UPI003AF449AC